MKITHVHKQLNKEDVVCVCIYIYIYKTHTHTHNGYYLGSAAVRGFSSATDKWTA